MRPGTRFRRRSRIDWSGASSGSFRTCAPPGTPRPVSFVFGSCRYLLLKWILHWGEESGDKAFRSILDQMREDVRTDFLLMVGDQIYADDFQGIDPDDHLDEFLARYRIAFGQPHIRELMGRVPTYMILDDHEIKDAWTMNMRPGREVLYASAMSAYQSYQVVHGPAFDPSGPGDAEFARTPTRYWYRYDVGPARFFVLDTRNERYVNLAGADPQIISSTQMSALLQWLAESPPEAPKFVVTSVPMFPDDRSEISDKWAGFPRQRRQLLEEIRSRGIRKVVFLAGDVHCSGWSELVCPSDPGFRVYSVISSPFFFPGPRLGQGDRFDLQRHHREPAPRFRDRRARPDPRRRRVHARLPRRGGDGDAGRRVRPQGRAARRGRTAPLKTGEIVGTHPANTSRFLLDSDAPARHRVTKRNT